MLDRVGGCDNGMSERNFGRVLGDLLEIKTERRGGHTQSAVWYSAEDDVFFVSIN